MQQNQCVLICHALSGNHHVAGVYADNPKNVVGGTTYWTGKPIDTRKFL